MVGAGKIGEAVVRALLSKGHRDVIATCRTERRRRELSSLPVPVLLDNREAVRDSDIVLISVKPYQVATVMEEVKDLVADKLIISVAASVKTSFIESFGDRLRVVRAMPNINIVAGYSATALCKGRYASEDDLALARSLFEALGYVTVVDESLMDAITAYSGSGPAYVLEFFEAFILAGLKVGLPRSVALELAIHTMIGTARLLEEAREHPAELRDMVITPGGVTIEGIHEFERRGFKSVIIDAVQRAYDKAVRLSDRINAKKKP